MPDFIPQWLSKYASVSATKAELHSAMVTVAKRLIAKGCQVQELETRSFSPLELRALYEHATAGRIHVSPNNPIEKN